MKRSVNVAAIGAAAVASTLFIAGCKYDHQRPAGTQSRAGTAQPVAGDDWGFAAQQRTARAEERARQPIGRIFGIPERAFPTGDDQTSLVSISLLSSQDQARVGQPFIYRMRVTNLSNDLMLEDVIIHQDLPGSVEVVDVQPEGLMAEGRPGEWRIGELSPGQTREFDIAVVPGEEGSFESCVRITYSPVLCTSLEVVSPQLQLSMDAPEQVIVCDPIPVRFIVANTGSGRTDAVTIQTQLPEGLVGPRGEQSINIPVGPLGPGERHTAEILLRAQNPGQVNAQARAVTDDDLQSETMERQITIVAPNLEMQLQGPDSEFMEREIEYTALIRNTGNGPALDSSLRIDLQGRARLTAMRTAEREMARPEGPGRDAPILRDNRIALGEIAPGETREVRFLVMAPDPGQFRLAATASAYCIEPPVAEITTQVRGVTSLHLELTDTNDPVRIGEEEIYHIAVLNQGRIADHDVQIVASLPEGYEVIDIQGTTPGEVDGQRITFAPVETLGAGQRAAWRIRIIAHQGGDHRFGVQLTSQTLEEPVIATEATRAY